MNKIIHNWVAVVAILAVALLGVLAIDRASDNRAETLREGQVNLCLRMNENRVAINAANTFSEGVRNALRGALERTENAAVTAATEAEYKRFLALLGPDTKVGPLPLIDCAKEIPKP